MTVAQKTPKICWVDIPADNPERSKKFYSELFGWKIEKDSKIAPGAPEYFTIALPKSKEQTGSAPHFLGGLLKRQNPNHTITIYIDVPSLDTSIAQVKKLGGQVLTNKMPVPGWGYFAICKDTENNAFALWEENKSVK